jgi:hypothetical protein
MRLRAAIGRRIERRRRGIIVACSPSSSLAVVEFILFIVVSVAIVFIGGFAR